MALVVFDGREVAEEVVATRIRRDEPKPPLTYFSELGGHVLIKVQFSYYHPTPRP